VVAASLVACNADSTSRGGEQKTGSVQASLTGQSAKQLLAWGDAPDTIGFRPGARESLAMGAPAVAVGANGQTYVLDALHERVVRATKGDLVTVAKVPRDCDDLAVAADGAIAVRRSVKPEVLVFTPSGELVGKVDTSAVEDVDAIALGSSRRVTVTNPFQESFLLGSPSAPQMPAAVRANKREGAAVMPDGRGIVAVHTDAGELELRVLSQQGESTSVAATLRLGEGDAARVVGVDRGVACARVEHSAQDPASKELSTKREVACVDVASGKTVFREELPPPGAYMPRRELSFAGGRLVFARPTMDGLELTTTIVERSPSVSLGGAR
jgi:hypothetical protein